MRWTLVGIMQALLLVAAGAGLGAYTVVDWPTLSGFTVGELHTVQKTNTAIVKSLGHSAALLYDNSDLLMRYNHWTVGHPKEALFCPECVSDDISQTSGEWIAEIDSSPSGVTSNDIVKDSEEVYTAVGAINMAILQQRAPLVLTLKRLRDKGLKSKPARQPTTIVTREIDES